MYCPKCGKKLPDTVKFCPNCGYRIKKFENEEKTKELNVGAIKQVEKSTRNQFKPNSKPKMTKNQNFNMIILPGLIIVLGLTILLINIRVNKKNYLFEDELKELCNSGDSLSFCVDEKKVTSDAFSAQDFSSYDFSVTTSKQDFLNEALEVLKDKNRQGLSLCPTYGSFNRTLGVDYSYLCGLNTTFLNNLLKRMTAFQKLFNTDAKFVDSYIVVEKADKPVHFTGQIIGYNNYYSAYLKEIVIDSEVFSDYEVLKKNYNREITNGLHPKNSLPEDVVISELAKALNLFMLERRYEITGIVIDDFNSYDKFIDDWQRQSYASEVVKKAVFNINKNSLIPKSEVDLQQTISVTATNSYMDTLAEGIIDCLSNRENASNLSKEIVRIINEDLKAL